MQAFLLKLLLAVIGSDEFKKLIADIIKEQVLPLVPVAVGAAVKAAVDEVVAKVPGVEAVVDLAGTVDAAVKGLEDLIPGIPFIGDVLAGWVPKL
jgi:hypothetical protein